MSNGFEAAKARRGWLERLGEKIPGFAGYRDRELRRDVDKLEREHLAGEVGRAKVVLRSKARAYTDAGMIAALTPFERIERRLDGMAQSIRFADYGASGFFDAVKIGEAELERLYEFDLGLVDDVAGLSAAVAAIPAPGTDPAEALTNLADRVAALEAEWARRESIVNGIVRNA